MSATTFLEPASPPGTVSKMIQGLQAETIGFVFPVMPVASCRVVAAIWMRFFWTVLIPNSRPVMGTMGLFAFLWTWNDFLWPLVIVKQDSMRTLQLGLSSFRQEFGVRWAELMAASVMATVPVIILFLFLQRFLVQGMATTGLKG